MEKGGNYEPDDRYFGLCDVCVPVGLFVLEGTDL